MNQPTCVTRPNLLTEVAAILRCTRCGASLEEVSPGYSCPDCRRIFPNVRRVARFVNAESYAHSFGYQWHRYPTTQLDQGGSELNEDHFRRKTGLTPDQLRGKLILDVGCGMGRFAAVATSWGARVVGIDLSTAVEIAAENLEGRDFVGFQADLFELPFAPESFDIIYSIGVLHHTPSCEQAFRVLPPYLKPGGTLAVWLYSGYNRWYRFSDQYRRVTHRMSIGDLHRILSVAVPVLYRLDRGLRAIPAVGSSLAGLVHHVFPVSLNPDSETRVLDTLDWYSPKYQSKHTYEEVFRWYESCGLEALTVADFTLGVRGRKPLLESRRGFLDSAAADLVSHSRL